MLSHMRIRGAVALALMMTGEMQLQKCHVRSSMARRKDGRVTIQGHERCDCLVKTLLRSALCGRAQGRPQKRICRMLSEDPGDNTCHGGLQSLGNGPMGHGIDCGVGGFPASGAAVVRRYAGTVKWCCRDWLLDFRLFSVSH